MSVLVNLYIVPQFSQESVINMGVSYPRVTKPTLYESTAATCTVSANRKKKVSAFGPLHEVLFANVAPIQSECQAKASRLRHSNALARQPQAPNRRFRYPDKTINGAE